MKTPSRVWSYFIPCCVLTLALMFVFTPQPAYAATYTVFVPDGTGIGTLSGAINSANASSSNDIINIVIANINLTGALPVLANNGTLTINGQTGGSIITRDGAAPAFRIFEVSSGANVTLNQVTVSNGNSGSAGGGIYNNGGTLTVTNSTISGNSSPGVGGSGGGIFSSLGTLNFTNSTLSGNSATGTGGGIYADSGTVTFTNSTVSGNFTSGFGNGGGIANGGATFTLDGTTISGNTATANGGGIISGSGTLDLIGSTITGNNAPNGAGIFNGGTLDVTDTEIINNFSTIGGGGLHNMGGTVTVTDSTFSGNEINSFGNGAAIYNRSGTVTVTNSTINNNVANVERGGGIANDDGGTVELIESHLTDNSATNRGGGIYNTSGSSIVMTESTLIGNEASSAFGGGGIYNDGFLEIILSSISTNEATVGGAILNSANGTLTLTRSTLHDNSATSTFGGGISNDGDMTVSRSTFTDNTSNFDGGAIDNGGTATITNSTFSGNIAGLNGGGISNSGGTTTVINSTLSANSATTSGGGGGGGVSNASSGTLNLRNTIVANSLSGGNCVSVFATTNAQYSLIEGGLTCVSGTNSNNKTLDPNLGTLTDNPAYFPLNAGSPAIDAGSNALVSGVTTDQAGNSRISGSSVDMGSIEFSVLSASLNVQLALQGRPAMPHSSYVITVHVQVRNPGSTTPLSSQDYITSTNGEFTLTNLVVGSYDLWIKGTNTLARVYPVTLVSGTNTLIIPSGQPLPAGDGNDNNLVTLPDFSILATAFGSQTGDANYDARADYNSDGRVILTDFSLLANNFGAAGAP